MKVWLVFEESIFAGFDRDRSLKGVFSEEALADKLASEKPLARSVESWDVEGPNKLVEEYDKGWDDGHCAGYEEGYDAAYVMQAVEKEGYKHYVRDIMMQSSSVADFKKKLVKGGMFPGSLSLLVKEWNKRRRK